MEEIGQLKIAGPSNEISNQKIRTEIDRSTDYVLTVRLQPCGDTNTLNLLYDTVEKNITNSPKRKHAICMFR